MYVDFNISNLRIRNILKDNYEFVKYPGTLN